MACEGWEGVGKDRFPLPLAPRSEGPGEDQSSWVSHCEMVVNRGVAEAEAAEPFLLENRSVNVVCGRKPSWG